MVRLTSPCGCWGSPRPLRSGRVRPGRLALSVLLGATGVAAAGAIGFVGLVTRNVPAPSSGAATSRCCPRRVLLGATPVRAAGRAGRTVIAPAQLGAGPVTAATGMPYFLCLLPAGPTLTGGSRSARPQPAAAGAGAAASQTKPSGSVNGPAGPDRTRRCDPPPSAGTPASLASAARL